MKKVYIVYGFYESYNYSCGSEEKVPKIYGVYTDKEVAQEVAKKGAYIVETELNTFLNDQRSVKCEKFGCNKEGEDCLTCPHSNVYFFNSGYTLDEE